MARHLHQNEVVLIADLLRRVCDPIADGGAEYHPGWSDNRVAASVHDRAPDINHRHITRLRQKIIGLLPGELVAVKPPYRSPVKQPQPQQEVLAPVSEPKGDDGLRNRVDGLTMRLDRLERELAVCNGRRIKMKQRLDFLSEALIKLYAGLNEPFPTQEAQRDESVHN
jgi:hypothetical protein